MKRAEAGELIARCADCPNYSYVSDWNSSHNDRSFCDETSFEILNTQAIPNWCPLPDVEDK